MTVHHTGDPFIKSTAKGLEALVSNGTYVVPIHLPDGERKQLRKAMLGWHGYLGQETIVFRSVGTRVHGNEFRAALVTLQNNMASSDAGTRVPTRSHPRLPQSGGAQWIKVRSERHWESEIRSAVGVICGPGL